MHLAPSIRYKGLDFIPTRVLKGAFQTELPLLQTLSALAFTIDSAEQVFADSFVMYGGKRRARV